MGVKDLIAFVTHSRFSTFRDFLKRFFKQKNQQLFILKTSVTETRQPTTLLKIQLPYLAHSAASKFITRSPATLSHFTPLIWDQIMTAIHLGYAQSKMSRWNVETRQEHFERET